MARSGRKRQRTPPAAQYDAIAELYDGYPGDYTEDLVFYAGEALAGGSPVLEIGAGTGRLTLGLAALGLEVVALDNSAAALQVLERKRAQAGGNRGQVSTVVADMRGFDLGRTFARVLVPFRTFLYLLTEDDQRRALRAFRRHLAPGGRLVMSFFVLPPALLKVTRTPEEEGARFPAPDGEGEVVAFGWTEFDHAARRVVSHFRYEWRGRRRRALEHQLVARYVLPEEMPPLLESCGYRVVAAYGDFSRRPLTADSREQIWVAEAAPE